MTASASVRASWDRATSWLTGPPHGLYGAAACRIALGLAALGLLLSNFSSREVWVGQGSVWAERGRKVSQFPEVSLLDGVSGGALTIVYLATLAAVVALILGWHTKAANVVALIGFIAIVAQNPVMADESDNLIRIGLLWLLLMQSQRVWSVDAWRSARRGEPSRSDVLAPWLASGLHHVGLLGLGSQTVLMFTAAGLAKVSAEPWQDGTALYSTLQLPEFRAVPALADLFSASSVLLAVLTYGVLMTQLFFAPLLLNRMSRRILIGATLVINALLAVMLGLMWSTVACLALVALFVSTSTYQRLDEKIRYAFEPVADWLVMRGYDLQDAWYTVADKSVYPAADWFRATVLRRY
jgi:hypothetical protein